MQFIRLTCPDATLAWINFDRVVDFYERMGGEIAGSRIVLSSDENDYFDVCELPKDIMALIQSAEQAKDRHLFASAAMNGLLSRPTRSTEPDLIATEAFMQADAMLSRPL